MPTLKAFDPFNPFCKFYISCTPSDGHYGYIETKRIFSMAQGYHKFEVLSFWHQEFKQANLNNEMLAKYLKSCCIIGSGLKSSEDFFILKRILWLKTMKN
jgi:hypothetical protein